MRRRTHPLAVDRHAAAALEFALVAPMFVLLLTGILAYSIYFAVEIAVVVAASEGARASVAGLSSSERTSLAHQAVSQVLQSYAPLLVAGNAVVTTQQAQSGNSNFQVTVSYNIAALVPVGIVPLPNTTPSFTATVGYGGY